MDDPRQPDMFGHSARQGEMFEPAAPAARTAIVSEKYGVIEPPPPGGHTRETIRAQMHRLIAQARAANTAPWPIRQVRTHMVMFPYMAEWLPEEEGKQLLLEFRDEMRRLGHAAPPALDQ